MLNVKSTQIVYGSDKHSYIICFGRPRTASQLVWIICCSDFVNSCSKNFRVAAVCWLLQLSSLSGSGRQLEVASALFSLLGKIVNRIIFYSPSLFFSLLSQWVLNMTRQASFSYIEMKLNKKYSISSLPLFPPLVSQSLCYLHCAFSPLDNIKWIIEKIIIFYFFLYIFKCSISMDFEYSLFFYSFSYWKLFHLWVKIFHPLLYYEW